MLPVWLLFAAVSAFLLACGVEAGNPGGGTKKGTLGIFIAKEPKLGKQQFTLALQEIQLVAASQEATLQTFAPQKFEFNLFEESEQSDGTDTQELGTSEITIGDYSQVVFKLSQDRPLRYVDREGASKSVQWEDPQSSGFVMANSFTIKEGEKTEILLSMNPYQSVVESSSPGGIIFKPRGDSRRRDLGQKISGKAPLGDAQWVCAYLFDPEAPPFGPPPSFLGVVTNEPISRSPGTDFPKRPALGPRMEGRVVFSTRDKVVLDEQFPCKNAFSQTPVKEDIYHLRQLVPGSYRVRFFRADQTFFDGPDFKVNRDPGK